METQTLNTRGQGIQPDTGDTHYQLGGEGETPEMRGESGTTKIKPTLVSI